MTEHPNNPLIPGHMRIKVNQPIYQTIKPFMEHYKEMCPPDWNINWGILRADEWVTTGGDVQILERYKSEPIYLSAYAPNQFFAEYRIHIYGTPLNTLYYTVLKVDLESSEIEWERNPNSFVKVL